MYCLQPEAGFLCRPRGAAQSSWAICFLENHPGERMPSSLSGRSLSIGPIPVASRMQCADSLRTSATRSPWHRGWDSLDLLRLCRCLWANALRGRGCCTVGVGSCGCREIDGYHRYSLQGPESCRRSSPTDPPVQFIVNTQLPSPGCISLWRPVFIW